MRNNVKNGILLGYKGVLMVSSWRVNLTAKSFKVNDKHGNGEENWKKRFVFGVLTGVHCEWSMGGLKGE